MKWEIERALALGFSHAAEFDPAVLSCRQEVRQMCKDGCNQYGKRWSCPPACGDLEECQDRLAKYSRGLLVQTVGELDDEFDGEGMMRLQVRHNACLETLAAHLRLRHPELLPVGTGCCMICPQCTYPEKPCRHPKRCIVPMEAYGLLVADVCKTAGLQYYYGPNTITYTACILIK